jgi:hypothetical protein
MLAGAVLPRPRYLNLSGPRCNPYYSNIGEQPVGDAGVAAWADSPNAATLEEPRLSGSSVGDDGLRALARSRRWQNLTTLDLSHAEFSPDAVAALSDSPLFQQVRTLNLSHTGFGDDHARAPTRAATARNPRSLDLSYGSIGPEGAERLAHWPVLDRPWILNLHDNVLGDDGLIALARGPFGRRLPELDLEQDCWNSRNRASGDGVIPALLAALGPGGKWRRMDALFAGLVDEYHGCAYGPGFTRRGWEQLCAAETPRPEIPSSLVAANQESWLEEPADGTNTVEAIARAVAESEGTARMVREWDFRNRRRREAG